MYRLLRVATIVLLVFFAGGSLFAQAQPKAAWPAYVLSITFGFGLGHFYCGDTTTGLLFLISDITGSAVFLVGVYDLFVHAFASAFASAFEPQSASDDDQSVALVLLGLGIMTVSRIWAIADVGRAVDKAKKAGRIAEMVPMIDVDIKRTSFELGASLRY